jgi:hypothetical protein
MKSPTTRTTIRHVFSPPAPSPMPNAWPARRDVCANEAPKELNRSPYIHLNEGVGVYGWDHTDCIVQHEVLALYVVVDVRRNLYCILRREGNRRRIGPTPRRVRILECSSSSRWSFWDSYVSSTRSREDDMVVHLVCSCFRGLC